VEAGVREKMAALVGAVDRMRAAEKCTVQEAAEKNNVSAATYYLYRNALQGNGSTPTRVKGLPAKKEPAETAPPASVPVARRAVPIEKFALEKAQKAMAEGWVRVFVFEGTFVEVTTAIEAIFTEKASA
jgi:hypothetical protein